MRCTQVRRQKTTTGTYPDYWRRVKRKCRALKPAGDQQYHYCKAGTAALINAKAAIHAPRLPTYQNAHCCGHKCARHRPGRRMPAAGASGHGTSGSHSRSLCENRVSMSSCSVPDSSPCCIPSHTSPFNPISAATSRMPMMVSVIRSPISTPSMSAPF